MADIGSLLEAVNDFGDRRYEEGLAAGRAEGRAEVKTAAEDWCRCAVMVQYGIDARDHLRQALSDLFAVNGWTVH